MTSAQAQGGTVIEIRGAWSGAVQDPERRFEGHVTASPLPGVAVGERVTVTYRSAASRSSGAAEHGAYVLNLGERDAPWPLMGFTCPGTAGPGHEGNDDTAEATWYAVPVPEA